MIAPVTLALVGSELLPVVVAPPLLAPSSEGEPMLDCVAVSGFVFPCTARDTVPVSTAGTSGAGSLAAGPVEAVVVETVDVVVIVTSSAGSEASTSAGSSVPTTAVDVGVISGPLLEIVSVDGAATGASAELWTGAASPSSA